MGLNDLTNEVKAALFTRLSSPAAGAFLISWCLWNIDAVLVITFGGDQLDMAQRISYVMGNYLNSSSEKLWYPLLMTAGWVLLYPLVSSGLFWYWEEMRVWKEKKRMDLAATRPIPAKEHKRLLDIIKSQKDEYRELLDEREALNIQIGALTEQITALKPLIAEVETLKSQLETANTKHLETQNRLHDIDRKYAEANINIDSISNNEAKLEALNSVQKEQIASLQGQLAKIKESAVNTVLNAGKYPKVTEGALSDSNVELGDALKNILNNSSRIGDSLGTVQLGDALKSNQFGQWDKLGKNFTQTYHPRLSVDSGEISRQFERHAYRGALQDQSMKDSLEKSRVRKETEEKERNRQRKAAKAT